MIPKECKRLAEVDFPIAEVSKHSAREKSIRHGHPSTLHLWWARRPLAACRAMLLGLLLPDPCDENCAKDFKKKARALLPRLIGKVGPKDEDLRKSLLKFIADFANWDNSSHPTFLKVGRGLVKAAHGEETPLVVDPFAGGATIPFEALRLGCDAFGSDLNPVACLILKVMLEDIPRHGLELAEALRGGWSVRQIGRADELGSGMRKMMKYGKAFGGADPELIEGDIFRIIVKCPDFEARQIDSTELRPELGAQSGPILQALCERSLSANELTEILGLRSKTGAFKRTIKDLLDKKFIEYTIPEKPNSRLQKYRLTDAGKHLLKSMQE